jgi:hypothetical protein
MTISYDKQVLIKRGNTVSVSSYVGPLGELVLDTDTNRVYVHDGVTVGGTLVGDGVSGTGSDYSNVNVAAYLPINPTITSLVANAGVQSANIATLAANAATQAGQISQLQTDITTANTNMKNYVDSSISANVTAIINGAPGALDTLNELANALGNNASFSTTITNSLATLTSNIAVQAGQIAALEANVGVSIYGDSNVAAYLPTYNGNLSINNLQTATVTGNLIPSANVTYSLGSQTAQWKDLWLSGNTIHIGDTALSVNELGQIESSGGFVVQNSTLIGSTDLGLGASLEAYAGDIANNVELRAPTDGSALLISNDSIKAAQTSIGVQGDLAFIAVHDAESNLPAFSWLFKDDGNLQLPVGGDIVDNNGQSVLGGAAGPVQPYLELTNTPFITQPAILTQTVTVTAAPFGVDARLSLIIAEGPTLDVETITVTTAGTGYVVGQQYRIEYWQIGGGNDESSIDFEVATVGPDGELLTITNVAFVGSAANTPGTYTNLGLLYQPSVFDEINTGLVLTRGRQQGIFNIASELEYDNDDYLSPLGTEWNSEGWGNLLGLGTRSYGTWRDALNGQVGNNIIGAELVMHDTINDKYYKFDFTEWGGNDGGFAYTRTLVEDPNYFRKTDGLVEGEIDVIVEDDGEGSGIGITRGEEGGIYNPYREDGWDSDVSPAGTLWNLDGWDDLTDIESRTYTNFYDAYGNGGLGNKVPGSKAIMYVEETDKYYAIDWVSWTQGGDYGGFSYIRREIDLDKLTQGITFADGTVQTTAYVDTNVVSTAPGQRRIETASGYKQVSVTERVTTDYAGTLERTTDVNYEIYVTRNVELDEVLLSISNDDVNADFEISLDGGSTYRSAFLASIRETEYWFYYNNNDSPVPQVAGDTVDIRILTGGDPVTWWSSSELPSGSNDFRGAVINYHAYTGEATWIGTIHIADDDGNEYITHTEVSSGDTDDSMNDNLWIVTDEGRIRYGRFDGEAKTLKIQWTATVFYGDETSD